MTSAAHRRMAAIAFAALLVLCPPFTGLHGQPAGGDEVRALWVVRTSLTSPAAVAAMVDAAKASGFNALLVQVRGRGDAYYQPGLEPRAPALATRPAFDPLEATVERAHAAGLKVHAWINVNLVAGIGELPSGRDHVVYRHPEWMMVPRQLADDLAAIDPRSPEYLGRIVRFARSQQNAIEGVYLSPIPDGAAAYTVGVIRDIVRRYAVDGVHLDYARYPSDEFDYSRAALRLFRESVLPDLGAAERRALDARLPSEPLLYTRAFPERWRTFRAGRLTTLVAAVRRMLGATKPDLLLSAAVAPDASEAMSRRLQDWRDWLARDLIDVACPMAYTTDSALFAAQIAGARRISGDGRIWAGIGAYRLGAAQIVEHVQTARRLGVRGVILFSYDSLTDPARGAGYLAQVGRAAFTP